MTERNLVGRVITASLIGGATCLGAYGVLEATSGRQQNHDKSNGETIVKDLSCIIPQTEKGPMGPNQVVLIRLKESPRPDAVGLILSEAQKNPEGKFCNYSLDVQDLAGSGIDDISSLDGEKLTPAGGVKVNLLFENENITFPGVLTGRGRQVEANGKPEAQAEVIWKNSNGIEESGYVGLNVLKVIPEKPVGRGGNIEIGRIATEGELVSFGDNQLGTITDIRYEKDQRNAYVIWYENGVRQEKWMSDKEYVSVADSPDQNSVSLPQNFELTGIWKNDFDEKTPLCLVCITKPFNEAYLRVVSIIGEPFQQVKLIQGNYDDFPMAANFYEIFFDKKKAAPEMLWMKWGEGMSAYDVLVEEIGHTRLIGWDYDSDQALARSLILLTRKIPESEFAQEPERWQAAKFFADTERKYPGFLKFWANKTNAWREEQYNGYRYMITPEIAKTWANEFKDKLWNELAYGLLQCQYSKQGEQVFRMPEQDCKDLETCELHYYPTTDGSRGTPYYDRAITTWDPQTENCHIVPEQFYGAACGGCLDKDTVK